ncbi:MAG: TSUP family transporter [Bacteroidetes bacterium]|nr:TSUP family transporter [Bacteroidota bacterium]
MDILFLPANEILILLCVVSFVAGYVDAMAGGSGLLTLPALLLAGLPAPYALGTNKLQSSFGSMTASIVYSRHGLVYPQIKGWMFPVAFVASFTGCFVVLHIDPVDMTTLIALVLVVIGGYFLFHKDKEEYTGTLVFSRSAMVLSALIIGFYDGFLGPGTGSFLIFVMLHFFKMDYLHAAANGKFVNWGSNLGALSGFFLAGKVLVLLGLCMGLFMFLGSKMGTGTAIRTGGKLIRPLVVIVSLALVIRLLMQN